MTPQSPIPTSELIERAERALECVTSGPWEHRIHGWDDLIFTGKAFYGAGASGFSPNDARFIAAARTLVPDLIAALRDAEAEKAKLWAVAVRAQGYIDIQGSCSSDVHQVERMLIESLAALPERKPT
jgi:hypothetical protein